MTFLDQVYLYIRTSPNRKNAQGFPTHTNGLINFQKLLKIEEQVRHVLYYQEGQYPNPTVGTPRNKTRRFVASIKAIPEVRFLFTIALLYSVMKESCD